MNADSAKKALARHGLGGPFLTQSIKKNVSKWLD
jgi:hypothetical protein